MPRWLATLYALISSAILLTSCATTVSNVPTIRDACEVFAPITWSKHDTPTTLEQIKEHNAAGSALCNWGK